jgi:3-oxoadipate enol-lactonase
MIDQVAAFDTASTANTSRGTVSLRRVGTGRALVLLHPLAVSSGIWRPVAGRLSGSFDVLAPDARGHGATSWDGRPFTVTDLAMDVVALLDALEIERVSVAGMSMGGSTAMVLGPLLGERLTGLVLLDTTAWYGPQAEESWGARADHAVQQSRSDQLGFQLDRWFTPETVAGRPDVVEPVVDAFLATSSAAHAAACVAMGALDAREDLSRITAPTLGITGTDDYATPPEMGRSAIARVVDGEFRELPGLRHLAVIERPELADDIAAFLTERIPS